MKEQTFDKFALTLLFVTLASFSALGQRELAGKYIRTDYPGGYLVLNSDKSFKFRYKSHAYWDLACGQYEVKRDTIFFSYYKDMFDLNCNSERLNFSDTSGVVSQDAIDKSLRPITARYLKNKILTIKTGNIEEPENVNPSTYYYRREKKKDKE